MKSRTVHMSLFSFPDGLSVLCSIDVLADCCSTTLPMQRLLAEF